MLTKENAPAATEAINLSNGKPTQTSSEDQGIKAALGALDAQVMETRPVDETDEIPFPVHCLPEQWQDLAVQSAELAQMPAQLPAMTMLATVSAAVGKAWITTGGSNHGESRANLYVIACAKSSTGKDVAARLAHPFFEFEQELQNNYSESEYAEDRSKPLLSVSNATSEALAARMQNPTETLFSFSAEAGDLMRVASGIYKNGKGEYSFYNGAWSGTHTQFTRMTRDDVTLASPCLSLFWAVQPDYFGEMTKGAEVSDEELEELNKSIADQLRVERLLEDTCGEVEPASDEEIEAIYQECKGEFIEPERVHAWHINKRIDGQTDQAMAMSVMEKAKAELEAGGLFELVVEKYSDCRERGGDLGFIYRGQMVEEFEDVVFNLGDGEVSDIFASRFGFHIARVTERRVERERSCDEVREDLEKRVAEEKKRKKLEAYLDKLRSEATVEEK